MMEAVNASETSIYFYSIAWRSFPGHIHLQWSVASSLTLSVVQSKEREWLMNNELEEMEGRVRALIYGTFPVFCPWDEGKHDQHQSQ
jgi:hypothetical protein